ncbi:MAG: hypothetical protein M1820_009551 [Bogoriella megaspora]|nr:MAG: hypothetical protein M1820_009551 [Bogoriella megaspora]
MENGPAASPGSGGGGDNAAPNDLERTKSTSPSMDTRSIRGSAGDRRRTISGAFLGKLPFIRHQNSTSRLSSHSDEALQVPLVDNAIDDAPRGSSAMARALKAQNKNRRRKGSLRKTALLGTGSKLRLERRGSVLQRSSSTRTQKDMTASPLESDSRTIVANDQDSIHRRRFSYEHEADTSSLEDLRSTQPFPYYSKPTTPFPLDPDPRPKPPPTPPLHRRPTYPSSSSTTSFEAPNPTPFTHIRRISYPSTTTSDDDAETSSPSQPVSRTTTADSLDPSTTTSTSTDSSYFSPTTLDGPPSSLKPSLSVKTIRTTTNEPPTSSSASTSTTSLPFPTPSLRRRALPSPLSHTTPLPLPYPSTSPLPSPPLSTSSTSSSTTAWYGVLILISTWLVFIVGMGSCLGVWSWAWDVGRTPYAPPELEDDETLPIVGYYPALMVLTGVVAWGWVTVAWVGMKYFRHAKVVGDD